MCIRDSYIGAQTVKALSEKGYSVTVFDDLSRGHPEHIAGVPLIIGRCEDEEALADVFSSSQYDAVMHFAGESQSGESVTNPAKYFKRNVVAGITLFSTMAKHGVSKLVFSSSASVYGDPSVIPISEEAEVNPKSPYAESKLFLERALMWFCKANGLRSISLRYFNAVSYTHLDVYKRQGNSNIVFVKNNEGATPTTVEVGINNEEYIEILSGLKERDIVILPPISASQSSSTRNQNTFNRNQGMPGAGEMPTVSYTHLDSRICISIRGYFKN